MVRPGRVLTTALIVVALFGVSLAGAGRGTALGRVAAGPIMPATSASGLSGRAAAIQLNRLEASESRHVARAMTNVHFILNWLPNVEFAGLWMATKFGWWQRAGIHMTFTGWSPSVHPETDVATQGGNTFGFQSGAAIIIARAQGVPIKAVYTDAEKSVFGLTVLANSGITSLKQLAGKRIGYQSHEFYVPATMMSCVGVPQTGWRPVQVGFDIVQLTAHHVDAYLTFITNEPIALAMNGVKTTTFHASQYCFHFYDDVMFTTDKLIKSNPKLVSTVTSIVARGFKWAHQHPQSAALYTVHNTFPASVAGSDIFGKATTANENQVQQIRELKAFDQFSRDPRGQFSGLMTASYWQDGINILAKYNQIKSKPAVGSLFTNQFNPNK